MRKYLFITAIIMSALLGGGYVLAAAGNCCLKTPCVCAKGECCVKGKCTCECACCTKDGCKCQK